MPATNRRPLRAALWTAAFALLASGPSLAQSEEQSGRVMLQFAPGVIHFNSSPDHVDYSWLVGAEYIWPKRWLVGYAYFNNSFGQKSHYAYGGYSWVLNGNDTRYWYLKLTGGVVIGYREPYEDKIPFNNDGIAPGIVPGLGYQYDHFNVQVNLLGSAALMVTFGYDVLR